MSQSLHKTRSWFDWNVSSHLAFLPAIILASRREPLFYELIILIMPTVLFSIIYHRLGEPRGTRIAMMDKIAANVLFIYGLTQIHFTKNMFIKFMSAIFAVVVATTHVSGQIYPHLWQTTHSMGMHVVSGVWCCCVAYYNDAIYF